MIDYKYYFLSTGRTASTLLYESLNNIEIYSLTHQTKYSRLINIIGNAAYHRILSRHSNNYLLIKYFGNLKQPYSTVDPLRSIPITLFLNSNKLSSNIKIIHIVRDPRDFTTSFMNWKKSSLKRTFLHHFVPLWQPNPYLHGDSTFTERLRMSKFEHFCWIWAFKNKLFRERFSNSQDYLLLKFEDIIDPIRQVKTLQTLIEFMDLDKETAITSQFSRAKVNQSKKGRFPKWREWDAKKANILNYWCSDLMNELGYGNEKEWKNLIK